MIWGCDGGRGSAAGAGAAVKGDTGAHGGRWIDAACGCCAGSEVVVVLLLLEVEVIKSMEGSRVGDTGVCWGGGGARRRVAFRLCGF